MYLEILHCGLNRWTKNWGDPLLLGSAVTALFVLAAALSLYLALRTTGREAWFWALAALAAALFGANVHLDLHVLPNAIGHCMANAQGWIDQKEFARTAFMTGAAVLLVMLFLAIGWMFWRQLMANIVLTLGFAVTVGIDAAKGFGRKGWEDSYDVPFGLFKLLDLPEIAGAALLIIGAALALGRLQRNAARGADCGVRPP